MRIAILEAGSPPARLDRFPSYGAMTARMIGPAHDSTIFDVRAGRMPTDWQAFDGYAVTGSAAGVYDPLPWIAPLIAALRALPPEKRLVGICFGHQVMAEAYGGRAIRSEKGRALGLHGYAVTERAPFMDDATRIAVAAFHQDQVVVAPPATRVLAASAFTPYAMLEYRDRAALSVQFHPEFEPDYTRALIAGHADAQDDPERAQAALASLDAPDDRHRVAGWIRRFLEQE
ncbi:glutamine amidotransferase-related protein [Methylobacterium sp. J-092]|uniref:glutamine amidotransferase-related protein n=1 Tax=Methylobacterium sp. J-092 TaxID=2836667 RepID=UPI001FBAD443|nr:gamma-glutamyl-gamma-aminobutyrate hydrolase family protein [Methylobacterium sp. J-092]MCJ2010657.1 gamma-glutamyl-gamma-aminobutyrate hydrolase family protein [Methylobacterium sp. J-092]